MSEQSPRKPFHVAVCGGGIGGLCLTIGLLHHGIPCTLYESAPAFAEIGAGVSFGPNAVRAMELLDPAIKDGFMRIATSNPSPAHRKLWFEFRLGMEKEGWKTIPCPGEEGELIARVRAGNLGQTSVHRAHFLDVLVKLLPEGTAQFGKRVDMVQKKDSKLELTFRDGTKGYADVVIGCDGVRSRSRQILLGIDHPTTNPMFTGKYAYRGLIPMETAVEAVGETLARNSQQYLGHHGHLLTFPIEGGKTMNVVAFQTKEDGIWDDPRWVIPSTRAAMLEEFKDWGENVKKLLSLIENPDLWALHDHSPAPTYYSPSCNFALLGDAAHASTPHQGAGAGQAIEDAFILSSLLSHCDTASKIPSALAAYDAIRRPRSQKVVKTSRDAVLVYEFEDKELGSDLKKVKERLENRYNWIWDEDMNEQLRSAEKVMGVRE